MKKNIFYEISLLILRLNPLEFSILSSMIGLLFVEGLDVNQINAIGNFFENIGQILLTYGAQMANKEEK